MGDMTSGGAPRIKSIVAAIQTVANAVLNGNVRTNLRRDDGTEIGTSTNPLVVDIGGDVPDTMDVTKIGGNAVASGSGVADAGTLRVAVATDDVNAAAIKTATEETSATLTAQLDITQSALRDAVQGDLETVQSSLDDVKAATEAIQTNVDVALSTLASESTLGSVKTVVEAIQTNVAHIDTRSIPEIASGTGTGAIDVSYSPGVPGAFYLCAVTIHLSAVPATAGDLAVVLDAVDGAAYDTVLFRVDPSEDGAMDIVYIPITSIPCVAGDVVNVNYANDDGLTYGVRIVAREV